MKVAFYGNCQLQALAGIYARFVCLFTGDDVRFIDAYRPIGEPDLDYIADAGMLVVQKAPMAIPTPWENFATKARTHVVPHVSAEFLWPYAGKERPGNPKGPGSRDGVYPGEIGDEFLNRLIKAGVTPDAAVTNYLALDPVRQMQLDRRYELAMDRLRDREAGTAYRTADIIEAHFRTEPLFRTPNHPTLRLSRYVALTFLREIGVSEFAQSRATKYLTVATYPTLELPIHPRVAAHFRLAYGGADQSYRFHDEGRLTFEQFVRQYMRGGYNAALFAGIENFKNGELAEALGNLQAGLTLSPCSALGHAVLAEALWGCGQADAARRIATQAARLDPHSPDYKLLIAKFQARSGDFPDARRSLEAAMALGAEPGPAYRFVASIAADQGRHAEALQLARDALNADPLDPLTPGVVGNLSAMVGHLTGAEAARLAALNLLRADRLAEAVQAARRAVELEPASANHLALLGDLLARTGATREGEAAMRSAVDLSPDDPGPRRQLAHWLRQFGNFGEAIPQMRKAVELKPENAENTAILAHMFAQSGNIADAEKFLRKAIDLAPDNDRYPNDLAHLLRSRSENSTGVEAPSVRPRSRQGS